MEVLNTMVRFLSILPLFALALASAPVIAQDFPDVPAMVNGAAQSSVAQAQNVAHAGSMDSPALAYNTNEH
jgi:hypothetical protein